MSAWHQEKRPTPRGECCAALVGAIVVLGSLGCQKSEQAAGTAVLAVDASSPKDHLAPGELPEGKERAFGLALPAGMSIDRRFFDLVLAQGPLPFRGVEDYFARRVSGTAPKKEEHRTVFRNVRASNDPAKLLEITIERRADHVRLEVRDVTPLPPPPEKPNDEERWKAAGLKPNGEPLDPRKLR